MCEWLSRGEWCDVQLVCAGRTFNAHRAVLASVSEFLRNMLLSCPQEETPIFILLPDFDLDIMSSVLYYIYNGEVTIERNKLLLFLEVLRTLNIFVDRQYYRMLLSNVESHNPDLHSKDKKIYSQNIFTLKEENGNEHGCVNIRKGERFLDIQSNSDPVDNTSSGYSRSDIPLSLENSPTFGDRQRNCFLRDLYIEAYPQNGNVNGVRGAVQAIPNEGYHGPTSVLLTNANGRFASEADNIFSKTTGNISDRSPFAHSIQQSVQNCFQLHRSIDPINFPNSNSYDLSNKRIFLDTNYFSLNGKMSVITCDKTNQLLPIERTHSQLIHTSSLDLRITESFSNSNSYIYNLLKNNMSDIGQRAHEENFRNNILKTPIFNQVIESPWRPRLPNSFKPFRRKDENSFCSTSHCKKGNEDNIVNDKNNNIENLTTVRSQYGSTGSVSTSAKEDFVCSICNQVFMSEDNLSTHTKRHTAVARYSCGECGKTFSQLRNFKYHMSVHRGTREFAATCTVCGKYFNDRGYLSSHMKIHRNRKEYKCPICPKSFNQRVAYNMHVRIHTGVKPHVCEECGKAFSRKMLLKQHQRTHSGERPYACPHCDKRFADRSNMTLHLRLHTGVKPFSCSLCPKSFTKKHHLKSHLNFHTGAKPYSCPRCHLAFTQSSNMRTHLKKCNVPEISAPVL